MKKMVALMLALVFALGMVQIASAAEPTVIQFWHSYGSGANLEATDKVVAGFNELYKGKYEVVATFQGNYAEALSKFMVAYPANENPTVSICDAPDSQQLITYNMLENITALDAADDEFDANDFLEGFMNYGTSADGTVFALPFARSTPLMYVNLDLVKEAYGEAVVPQTWDDFLAVTKAVRDNTDKLPFTCEISNWFYGNFVTAQGYQFLSDDGLSSMLAKDDAALKGLEWWGMLKDEGIYAVPPLTSQGSWMLEEFYKGNLAILFQSTGNARNVAKNTDGKFEVAAGFLPAKARHAVSTGGGNIVMFNNRSDAEKEAGWAFLKYATNLENNAIFNADTGYMLTHKESASLESVQKLWAEAPMFKVAYDQLQHVYDCYVSPYWAELNLEIVKTLQSFLQDGTMSAEQAYQEILFSCETILPNGNIK